MPVAFGSNHRSVKCNPKTRSPRYQDSHTTNTESTTLLGIPTVRTEPWARTDHPNVMGTEHHTSNMTDVSNNTIESNQRNVSKWNSNRIIIQRLHKNEHWKARQPHLGRTFPEVQTGPTSDRNEADRHTSKGGVGGNFIFTSKISRNETRKRRLQPTNQSYYQSQRVVYSHHTSRNSKLRSEIATTAFERVYWNNIIPQRARIASRTRTNLLVTNFSHKNPLTQNV